MLATLKASIKRDPEDWIWVAWLLLAISSFAVLEGRALSRGTDTLSRATWKASKAWPPLGVVFGILVGGLGVHFFWSGSPFLSDDQRGG